VKGLCAKFGDYDRAPRFYLCGPWFSTKKQYSPKRLDTFYLQIMWMYSTGSFPLTKQKKWRLLGSTGTLHKIGSVLVELLFFLYWILNPESGLEVFGIIVWSYPTQELGFNFLVFVWARTIIVTNSVFKNNSMKPKI
jgi:hypothetical protein